MMKHIDPEGRPEVTMLLGMIYKIHSGIDVEIMMLEAKEKNKLSIGAYVLFISLVFLHICILKEVCY